MQVAEQKRALLSMLLELCPFVHVLGQLPSVEGLPTPLQRPDLILRLGRDPAVIFIPDLVIDAHGFSCTLSVRPHRYAVRVPWAAVMRYWVGEPFSGPVVVWGPSQAAVAEPPKPERPVLRVVKDDEPA